MFVKLHLFKNRSFLIFAAHVFPMHEALIWASVMFSFSSLRGSEHAIYREWTIYVGFSGEELYWFERVRVLRLNRLPQSPTSWSLFFKFAVCDIGIGNVFIFQSKKVLASGCVGLENDSFNSRLRVYCLRLCNRVSRHGCDVTESFCR